VTVTAGSDVQQDILMAGSAQPLPQTASSWIAPAALPLAGDWEGSLSGYGNMSYFVFPAQANRTLSVAVTARDEFGNGTLTKAQPVIGMWAASDPPGTVPPAFTPSAFNQSQYGLTRLDVQVASSSNLLIGISDVRGDGRPDYRYQAHVLYADSVSPVRVSVNGGAVTVRGTGFASQLTAMVGSTAATPLSVSTGQLILVAPAHADGLQSIAISDPVSGASSVMTSVLTYGAAASDNIVLLGGINRSTAVGTQAANPMTVRVLSADGVTPVSGATIGWSPSGGVQLSSCGGASSCATRSDQNGYAATWLTPAATGVSTISATLAPGVYSISPSVSVSLNATESASDIGVLASYLWIAQGATTGVPLTARVVSNGAPQNNVTVNYTVVSGNGTLSAASAKTSSTGYATVTLTVTQLAALVQVTACVGPTNSPCQTFYANAVPMAQQTLQPVSGGGQVSTGQSFQPVTVRVTDSASPPNAVIGASVSFQTTVLRPGGTSSAGGGGETNPGNPAMPVILAVSRSTAITDMSGLASVVPSASGFSAPFQVDVGVTAGSSSWLDYPLEVFAPLASGNTTGGTGPPSTRRLPVRIAGPIEIQER
jgi:hypothetical protein